MRAAWLVSLSGSPRTAARAAPAASPQRPAAVRWPASASRACRRSCRQSSASTSTQSSYQSGSRSADKAMTALVPRSPGAGGTAGSSSRRASALAWWMSTVTPSARPSSNWLAARAIRAVLCNRDRAARKLEYAQDSEASGHSAPASAARSTIRACSARNASKRREALGARTTFIHPPGQQAELAEHKPHRIRDHGPPARYSSVIMAP